MFGVAPAIFWSLHYKMDTSSLNGNHTQDMAIDLFAWGLALYHKHSKAGIKGPLESLLNPTAALWNQPNSMIAKTTLC